jgi:hypothetical protein
MAEPILLPFEDETAPFPVVHPISLNVGGKLFLTSIETLTTGSAVFLVVWLCCLSVCVQGPGPSLLPVSSPSISAASLSLIC